MSGYASERPVITASPDRFGPLELPACIRTPLFNIRIYDRDSLGPTRLAWSISAAIHGTNDDFSWVHASASSGTIAPADSEDVAISINTCGLAGEYLVDLRIDSNDPDHPRLIIPMTFAVVTPVQVQRRSFGALKARYR
jgi:hypothetical protein